MKLSNGTEVITKPYREEDAEEIIFVLSEIHRQGIGNYIIDTLESDELFLRAERIEIPTSITAVEFYRKKRYEK